MDETISKIILLEKQIPTKHGLNNPHILSEIAVKLSVLLARLTDPLSEEELKYKGLKAKKYDALLKAGEKRSPANDALRYDRELIKQEIAIERIKGYVRRTDQIISTLQTHIRVKENEARNNQ